MATHASEADLETTVPDGDEDNKVCEEGVKLMADPLYNYNPQDPLVVERVPKGETRRIDSGMGRKQMPLQLSSLGSSSRRGSALKVLFFHTSCLLSAFLEEQKELKRQGIKEEDPRNSEELEEARK